MKFTQRVIRLLGDTQKQTAIAMLNNLPLGHGLEIVARETPKARSLDQNNLLWAVLTEISEQVWADNRQFSAECWHEYFKDLKLPNGDEENIAELVKDPARYQKWSVLPDGSRTLTGSTTDLTKYGFSEYMEQLYQFSSERGVSFAAREYA
jgi:hypothetical protein